MNSQTKKIRCHCPCHSNPDVKHIKACCINGYREVPDWEPEEKLFDNGKGAEFSECGKYRYRLWRIWNSELPLALCIGLNPSTANADKDDPTISNLRRVLTMIGYGGFYMMNCWAYISSDPKLLKINPVSDEWNNNLLTITASKCETVIFAWGNFDIVKETGRDSELAEMFPMAQCFGFNQNGTPMHPLALMYSGALKTAELKRYKKA